MTAGDTPEIRAKTCTDILYEDIQEGTPFSRVCNSTPFTAVPRWPFAYGKHPLVLPTLKKARATLRPANSEDGFEKRIYQIEAEFPGSKRAPSESP